MLHRGCGIEKWRYRAVILYSIQGWWHREVVVTQISGIEIWLHSKIVA